MMWDMASYVTGTVIISLSFIVIYHGIFGLKLRYGKREVMEALAFVVLFAVLSFFVDEKNDTAGLFLRELAVGVSSCFILNGNFQLRVLAYIPAYILYSLIDNIVALFWHKFMNIDAFFLVDNHSIGVDNQVNFIILLSVLLCAWLLRGKSREIYLAVTRKSYILFIVAMLGVTVLLSMVSYSIFYDEKGAVEVLHGLVFPTVCVGVVDSVLIFYIVQILHSQKQQNQYMEMIKKKNMFQEQYYKLVAGSVGDMRKFRHDYRYHMQYIRQQIVNGNSEEALKYIDELEVTGARTEKKTARFSGNHIIDSVICGMLPLCEENEVELKYCGKVKDELRIADVDLCALFSNIFENAIEGCCNYAGKRYIRIMVAVFQEALIIEVSNPCGRVGKKNGMLYATSKKDKRNHGYGMQNVNDIVERYCGEFVAEESNGIFNVRIVLDENNG